MQFLRLIEKGVSELYRRGVVAAVACVFHGLELDCSPVSVVFEVVHVQEIFSVVADLT